MRPDGRRHTIKDLYHEDTYFDFLSRRWRWALVSGVLLLISLGGFLLRGGLNLGLDFTGGTAWQLTISPSKDLSTADIRGIVSSAGISDPKIVILGSRRVRVEASEVAGAGEQRVTNALAEGAGISARAVSVSEVGPSWGDQVSREALLALIFFFVAVALYLSVRFEFKMAMAALAAVVHDILITVGVYAVTGIEVTPATVIAFLTILGFSLYDTVVVFDKIGENTPQLTTVKGMTYTSMANRSLNQVLMRSLNTSFVALLPVTSLLVVGVGSGRRLGVARVRARAVHRSAHRHLLVDLRGDAAARGLEGARAALPGAPGARGGSRRSRRHPRAHRVGRGDRDRCQRRASARLGDGSGDHATPTPAAVPEASLTPARMGRP